MKSKDILQRLLSEVRAEYEFVVTEMDESDDRLLLGKLQAYGDVIDKIQDFISKTEQN